MRKDIIGLALEKLADLYYLKSMGLQAVYRGIRAWLVGLVVVACRSGGGRSPFPASSWGGVHTVLPPRGEGGVFGAFPRRGGVPTSFPHRGG